ncbi:MAG: hypothetical protein OXP66_16215 [Candidatus Tectomicrobia bacterium]|nr:hypothetical protein [Candidatus Tectomicrobia bacterium]
MSPETLSTLAVGVALLAFGWRVYASLRRDIDRLRSDTTERLARVEATLDLLVRGLHIEVGKPR